MHDADRPAARIGETAVIGQHRNAEVLGSAPFTPPAK